MDDKQFIRGRRTYDIGSDLGENHKLGAPGSRYGSSDDLNFDAGLPVRVDKANSTELTTATQEPQSVAQPPQRPQSPTIDKSIAVPQVDIATSEVSAREAPRHVADIPRVLTWEAVRKREMPALGDSGLPASLEQDVPPDYRFWKCDSDSDARKVRDELVESMLFADGSVMFVDGEPRRVVEELTKRVWLAGPYDDSLPPVVPAQVSPIQKVAEYSASERAMLLIDVPHVDAFGIDHVMQTVRKFDGDWIVAARDSESNRAAMGACFRLRCGGDGLIFATIAKLDDTAPIECLVEDRQTQVLREALANDREIRLIKSTEERIVFGVVLEPDTIDAQGDTIPAEEIRQAAHKFMEHFGQLGLQHKEVVNGKLKLLESFIAPVDFDVSGQSVKKGTWLMAERVVDDRLWAAIRKGAITGYSIGGTAFRRKVSGE